GSGAPVRPSNGPDLVSQELQRQLHSGRTEMKLEQDGAAFHSDEMLLALDGQAAAKLLRRMEPEDSPARDPPSAKGAHRRCQAPRSVGALCGRPGDSSSQPARTHERRCHEQEGEAILAP